MELSFISGKVYSEPWHNGTFVYFRKWSFLVLYFSYILETNFPCSKNEKKNALKKFLIFQETELSSLNLKKSLGLKRRVGVDGGRWWYILGG